MPNQSFHAQLSKKSRLNQKGANLVDALGAMVISSMIATVIVGSLTSNIMIESQASDFSTALFTGKATVEKASLVSWSKLGFTAENTTDENGRFTLSDGTTADRVFLTPSTVPDPLLVRDQVVTQNGKTFNVHTDVYWDHKNTGTQNVASGFGKKHITVTVTWKDRTGKELHSVIDSARTPNLSEAIPYGITAVPSTSTQ